ncbi:MAG: FtsH protease activity modulator HflK [Clostridiales bacterium]|nr:FtsH protease activity modulator HflK [Clostridiales bacterium]
MKKQWKTFQGGPAEEFEHFRDCEEGNVKEKLKKTAGGIGKGIKIAALVIVAMFLLFNTFYKVGEQQQAVITMFGKVVDTKGAGLYAKVPFVQKVHRVDTTTHGLQIGYRTLEDGTAQTVPDEALMITSDFNFVDVDFYLEYRVSNPEKYLYASSDPVGILRNTAQACIRTIISNYTVDDVITTGKNQIQADIRDMLNEELNSNDIGLQLVNLTIQDAEPPTDEIMQAFKSVETAKQGKETAINNARKYQSEKVPQAEADADRIVQQAEAAKAARISEAEGQVARFNEMYAEYIKNPLITKQRIFYETMEEVLPGAKVVIDNGGTQKVLPLEPFAGMESSENSRADNTNDTNVTTEQKKASDKQDAGEE